MENYQYGVMICIMYYNHIVINKSMIWTIFFSLIFINQLEESSQESLRQTKDGGWICGEDIDVSVDEGHKKATDVEEEEEEEVPLDVQLGKGELDAGSLMGQGRNDFTE